jgi:hypothetical protein
MKDELFLAWAAGFFDGEGCVLVSERKNQTIYQLFVSVTQQDPTALHLLKQRFGGNVTPDKTAVIGYERKRGAVLCWRWKSTSSVAHDFLKAIEPYVVVKAEQVRVALAWPTPGKKYNGVGMPEEIRIARRKIMHDLRALRQAHKVFLEVAHG